MKQKAWLAMVRRAARIAKLVSIVKQVQPKHSARPVGWF